MKASCKLLFFLYAFLAFAEGAYAEGPIQDPTSGIKITEEDRTLMPSGRHVGEIANTWFVNVMNLQVPGNGISTFDPLRLSMHGRSYLQSRYFLNGLEITDPGNSGTPLFEVPYSMWKTLGFSSLWTAAPGTQWGVELGEKSFARGGVRGGLDVGGGAWIIPNTLDKDPASSYGAPNDRRKMQGAIEGVMDGAYVGKNFKTRLAVEHIDHNHRYLNTGNQNDHAARTTVLNLSEWKLKDIPMQAMFGFQQWQRDLNGAQYRFPKELTYNSEAQAFLGQLQTTLINDKNLTLSLQTGFGYRSDNETPNGNNPIVSDVENEWLWLNRPEFATDTKRWRYDAQMVSRYKFEGKQIPDELSIRLRGSYADVQSTPHIQNGRTGTTYQNRAISQTVYDPVQTNQTFFGAARADVEFINTFGVLKMNWLLALDYAGIRDLNYVSAAAGIKTRFPMGQFEGFALWRYEPEALTSEVANFLSADSPSGLRSTWNDDGDGIPEEGEVGTPLNSTGGAYHAKSKNLKRPYSQQIALGFVSPQFGPFKIMFAGVGRFLLNRYTVRYADGTAPVYQEKRIQDPSTGGRGEEPEADGRQYFTVSDRLPGGEGQERYELTNSLQTEFFLGLELQMLSVVESWWFLNFSGVAYLSVGDAPFGSYGDRNDPGAINESSADPNSQINSRGRYDHDRSFGLNVMTGVKPVKGLSIAAILSYRDGQPFTRIFVDDTLAQGPTPIMGLKRGRVRKTFRMTLDTRVRYEYPIKDFTIATFLDVYNLIGSGTEIAENPLTNADYRSPLEMIPGRSVFLSAEVLWK